MAEPLVWFFSLDRNPPSQVVPLGWVQMRRREVLTDEGAIEVLPGVRMRLLGTGDVILPDPDEVAVMGRGALVAFWRDVEWGVRFASDGSSATLASSEGNARAVVTTIRQDRPEFGATLACRDAARPAGPWREVPDA